MPSTRVRLPQRGEQLPPSDKQLDRMEDWFKIAHQHTRTAFLAYTNPKMRSEVWKEFGDL